MIIYDTATGIWDPKYYGFGSSFSSQSRYNPHSSSNKNYNSKIFSRSDFALLSKPPTFRYDHSLHSTKNDDSGNDMESFQYLSYLLTENLFDGIEGDALNSDDNNNTNENINSANKSTMDIASHMVSNNNNNSNNSNTQNNCHNSNTNDQGSDDSSDRDSLNEADVHEIIFRHNNNSQSTDGSLPPTGNDNNNNNSTGAGVTVSNQSNKNTCSNNNTNSNSNEVPTSYHSRKKSHHKSRSKKSRSKSSSYHQSSNMLSGDCDSVARNKLKNPDTFDIRQKDSKRMSLLMKALSNNRN